MNTTSHDSLDQGSQILILYSPFTSGFRESGSVTSVGHGLILQITFTTLIAHGAIERMICEKKFHDALSRKVYEELRRRMSVREREKERSSLNLPRLTIQNSLPRLFNHGSISLHPHSRHDRVSTRSDGFRNLFHLHQTHSAVTRHGQAFMITKAWNIHTQALASLDQRRARRHLNGSAVNKDFDCFGWLRWFSSGRGGGGGGGGGGA